ncbi:cyclin-T2 isoform X1 [Pelobates cultripes]|uniref:Cyclin-T2 isoform X1 n=1 Tax=Pelobates cultripes TaxID=61616 RepID=A0AAD1SRP6_PELCU|nr:cyclin-T2 isoform X1 [Pelobates cultripes]
MAECRSAAARWFFTREQLESSPSRRCGVEADKELSYRQQAANLIQDMGQRLNVSQLTINTAIVYMHRFYMHHSFTKYHRNVMSPTALFLAAKVEEQPRKLEHVIKVSHACLNPDAQLDTKSDTYLQQAQELVILETVLLQTLGFEITIEHPHTDVVKCTQLVRASKDLAQTSYFMATNSLHLTTFCLQYKPTVIACVCIHLACKWSNWEIPVSTDGKHWWEYVDQSVTLELLDELTHEFLQILEKTPSRLKRIRNWRASQAARKPKSDGQLDNSLLGPSLVQNSILMDPVAGITANASFPKASSSTFPPPIALNSGSMPIQAAHNPDELAILATAMPSTSYTMASHHEWPQHQEQPRTEVYNPKTENSLPVAQFGINFQQATAVQLHSGLHRADKGSEHSIKPEHAHKPTTAKHHGQIYAPPMAVPHKMSLDKYREKRKQETVEVDARDMYAPVHMELHHKKHTHIPTGSSLTSPPKLKIQLPNSDKTDKHSSDKKDKGVSLKLRIPIPPGERPSNKEDLKMKIKVPSADRHSSSDEGSGKSKHSSPHLSKEHKEKHKEHSFNRHHSSSHKHSHSHGSGSSINSNRLYTDGMSTTVLRSPIGLSNDGGTSNSSSSRKRPHPNDASYNHHSKMSKSSKTSGSSTSSSSSKQFVSSHNAVLNQPLPPPPPVTYQVGYGHISTLVNLDTMPVENSPEHVHEYNARSQHTNYTDTFDILDSLLSAPEMNT